MKLFASLLVSMLANNLVASQQIVQTYFIPMPETDLFQTFKDIAGSRTVTPVIHTTISIAIASDDTTIFYDHWEDGFYDAVPAAPNTTSTTLIWGDGDLTNGVAPGYPTDTFGGGDVITLDNLVPLPRDPGLEKFDGSDRISATFPIAVTRSAFPDPEPGSLIAGGVEVFNRGSWGREFTAIVTNGQTGRTDPFQYAAFYIMAGFDSTEISVNGNLTYTLNTGESVIYNITMGDIITATRDIQVDLVGGDIGSQYELRWFAQVDSRDWTNEYYSPVAESIGTTGFWFYNPNDVAIDVKIEGAHMLNTGLILTIPSKTTEFIEARVGTASDIIQIDGSSATGDSYNPGGGYPTSYYTGLRFSTENGAPFYGVVQVDADGTTSTDGELFDWGFPLIPSNQITSQALVGRGDGCTNNNVCGQSGRIGPTSNRIQNPTLKERSVVWIVCMEDTVIFVDFDGNGVFDKNYPLPKLASLRITDTVNNDNSMTGAIIASTSGRTNNTDSAEPDGTPIACALAWGQDPIRSGSVDNFALDLGTLVVPLANPYVSKEVVKVVNPDGSDDTGGVVDEVGDIIFYQITVSNIGFRDLRSIVVLDPLISNQPLTNKIESGATDNILVRGETWTYPTQYVVTEADIASNGAGTGVITNRATVTPDRPFPPVDVETETPILFARISGTVFEDIDNTDSGDVPIPGSLITLSKVGSTGPVVIATTLTDGNGFYIFEMLQAGDYVVAQTNLPTYSDVSDIDGGNPNSIDVLGVVGEDLEITGNDFVDERLGSISGSVKDDNDAPIPSVVLELTNVNGTVVATTITDSQGNYVFSDVGPSNYTVTEPFLPLYPIDILDQDNSFDGDVSDLDTVVDNMIGVTLEPGENDEDNNFVDSAKGSITGSVSVVGGAGIPNVLLTLFDGTGAIVSTTLTDANGSYSFAGLEPGNYEVAETNSPLFPVDVSDKDDTPELNEDTNTDVDNIIQVILTPGEIDADNNFVDDEASESPSTPPSSQPSITASGAPSKPPSASPTPAPRGMISGMVLEDVDGDGSGDEPITDVLITLLNNAGVAIATTLTDSDGNYVFPDLLDGTYTVVQTNKDGTYIDVSDTDGGNPNSISVTLTGGTGSGGNDFVDTRPGSITGSVTDDSTSPIPGVLITLNSTLGVVATTLTDSEGNYEFTSVLPGVYTVVEEDPPGFESVSDQDATPDGDTQDSITTVDNIIGVTLRPTEVDSGNNFVDRIPSAPPSTTGSGMPSASPSTSVPSSSPSLMPVVDTRLPSVSPSISPSTMPFLATAPPRSDFCCEVQISNACVVCGPYKSIDFCEITESFPALIQTRTSAYRADPTGFASNGWWFHYLEDKIAAYLLSTTSGVNVPTIFCCVTDATALAASLLSKAVSTGIVIKATNFHSNQGVFVLTNYTSDAVNNPEKPWLFDTINGIQTSYNDVVSSLSFMSATKIIVEEFIGTSLPTEYKFHVIDGVVMAIDIIDGRGGDCPCYAVVDTKFDRLDRFGCFEPGTFGMTDVDNCNVIDFTTGQAKCGPVKKDLYICQDIPTLPICLLNDMIATAESLSTTIGVYMRIDMFVAGGQYYVQEYTPNHMNGIRHCAAKFTDGCIDSCFLGRAYNAAGQSYGGTQTTVPAPLDGYLGLTADQQCALVDNITPSAPTNSC